MAKGLFSECLEKRCSWCISGHPANDGTKILCKRKGVVDSSFCCRKYKYDPLKRVPISPPTLPKFDSSDFSL